MGDAALEPTAWKTPRSLYLHVPFCRSKCSYCDFFSVAAGEDGGGAMDEVVLATLERARELSGRFAATGFDTVYVGGGTPSVLPRPTLGLLLAGVANLAGSPREWTMEANPESIDEDFLDMAEGGGVTRLSVGVQSLDPRLLRVLERPAGAEASLAALALASKRKFELSADLIAGLPRAGGILEEARILVSEGIGHLSVYDLVLEEGTPLERLWRAGGVETLSDDEAQDEREAMEEWLASRGYKRYEISNYSLPGRESLHNLAYWRMDSWLGAGPGAVSTVARSVAAPARAGCDGASLRIEEAKSLTAYREGRAGRAARETVLGPRDSAFEALMMAFRTREGLDEGRFGARFGLAVEELVGETLERWRERLVRRGGRIALDARGLDLGNGFLASCLLELERRFPAGETAIARS